MGNERWIVNASPLILLWKADYLYLLPELADVICVPKTVKGEIQAQKKGIIRRARPVIHHLCDVGLYASDELVQWVLSEVGE